MKGNIDRQEEIARGHMPTEEEVVGHVDEIAKVMFEQIEQNSDAIKLNRTDITKVNASIDTVELRVDSVQEGVGEVRARFDDLETCAPTSTPSPPASA